jgi:6,7-dimethyl-8-ribityllumazine synthase
MPKYIEGQLDAKGRKFAIVVSRFNSFISERLLEGALDCLLRHGAKDEHIHVFRVPGSFEIPFIARRAANTSQYDGVLCLGTLIRGSTPHFDYIAGEAAKGVAQASTESGVPVSFGILTCDTLEQAIERAGTKMGNKGWEAALALIELVHLVKTSFAKDKEIGF